MNLETSLMGIGLKNPIIVGSSSLTNSLKNVKKCEEAGAGAVVLKSLYEEQILIDSHYAIDQDDMYQWYPEAMDYVKSLSMEQGLDRYLELIQMAKKTIDIPVFASINCFSRSKWVSFARELENAGADAIELNIGIFPENEQQTSADLENKYLEILKEVKNITKLPLAVKMSTYFSNIKRMSHRLVRSGASSLVLFNRFYRPDIDIDNLHMITRDTLSGPEEITLSLRWVGLLSGKLKCDIVASTGIHNAEGVIKQVLAGAAAAQVCSVLYENGIHYLREILSDIQSWMKRKGYENLNDFKGLINKDPQNSLAWERIHFMKKSSGRIIKPITSHF
jgi:dihydroorotate dehydrogenase (fumarate)